MHIYYSSRHQQHDTDSVLKNEQPIVIEEVPRRVEIIRKAITKAEIGPILEPDDYGIAPILAVHDAGYINFLEHIYPASAAYYGQEKPVFPETFSSRQPRRVPENLVWQVGYYAFGVGTPILRGTWHAAYWAAQCSVAAASAVKTGAPSAYALCRPPGHHAMSSQYGGFCYLNNAAVAAMALGGRGAILDIDYHHGNGTQEIFYTNPEVLYCSLHAHPDDDYPFFWGASEEQGEGPGLGANYNWPLPLGCSEAAYLAALDEVLNSIISFKSDWLVLSAGFDIGEGDPVGGFHITQQGFAEIGRRIARLGLPTVIVQEGGYLLDGLGDFAVALLREFVSV